MSSSRFPYTLGEDKKILRYIIDGHYEAVVTGNALWIKMDEDNCCPGRSWQSLKNRFKRHIMPDLSRPEYGLTRDERVALKSQVSSSTSDKEPLVKRRSDVHLIREKLEKNNSNDAINVDSSSENGESDENGSPSASQAFKTSTASARLKPPLTPPDKLFFSLDMQWSDSD